MNSPDPKAESPTIIDDTDSALCRLLRIGPLDISLLHSITDADWEALAARAAQRSLASVLYTRLRDAGVASSVPTATWQKLRKRYREDSVLALNRYHLLQQILSAFQDEQIPVVLLKGAYLAEAVYRDTGQRRMSDLDLLVHQENLSKAVQIMRQLEYHPKKPFDIDNERQADHHLPPLHKENDLTADMVEIHWTLFPSEVLLTIDLPGLWQRARPVKVNGGHALALSTEDLLLHLCLHAAVQHRMHCGLRPVFDIATALARFQDGIDWLTLQDRARQWKGEEMVYLMLRMSHKLFGAPLPPSYLAGAQPKNIDTSTEAAALYVMLRPKYGAEPPFSPGLADFEHTKGWYPRLRHFIRRAFPPRDVLAERYPGLPGPPRLYFYYILNLYQRARSHGPLLWRLLRGEPATLASADDLRRYLQARTELEKLYEGLVE